MLQFIKKVMVYNEVYSSQRIKAKFVSNLWTWANLYSDANSHALLDFLTWMGSK